MVFINQLVTIALVMAMILVIGVLTYCMWRGFMYAMIELKSDLRALSDRNR